MVLAYCRSLRSSPGLGTFWVQVAESWLPPSRLLLWTDVEKPLSGVFLPSGPLFYPREGVL